MNYQLNTNELDFMDYLNSMLEQRYNPFNRPLFTLTKESHITNADDSAIHCYVYEPQYTSLSSKSPKIIKGQYEAIKRRALTSLRKYIPNNYRKVYQNQVDNTFIFESNDHDLITYKITDTSIIITIQYSGQY